MIQATVNLKSISPYSQGRKHEVPKLDKESDAAYDERTWRERLHYDCQTGEVYIPPMAFKNALASVAKYLSVQIPGKGKATYTKHVESGVIVMEPLMLGIYKGDVVSERIFVPSDGKRGGGKRVYRTFPVIHSWSGDVVFTILDQTVTKEVFENFITEAGRFIGIGRWRPERNGLYGRYLAKLTRWEPLEITLPEDTAMPEEEVDEAEV